VQPLAHGEGEISHPLLLPLCVKNGEIPASSISTEYFGIESQVRQASLCVRPTADSARASGSSRTWHIFLQLFGCELESSSLPRSAAFVPLVQQSRYDVERTE